MEINERNLSRQARRKLARAAKRTAKKRQMKKKLFAKRMKSPSKLKSSSEKAAKNLIVKKLKDTRNVFFKSIVSKVNIPKGKIIKMADLAFKKPGHGIPTKFYKKFLGKKANKTIKKNMIIKFSDIN